VIAINGVSVPDVNEALLAVPANDTTVQHDVIDRMIEILKSGQEVLPDLLWIDGGVHGETIGNQRMEKGRSRGLAAPLPRGGVLGGHSTAAMERIARKLHYEEP